MAGYAATLALLDIRRLRAVLLAARRELAEAGRGHETDPALEPGLFAALRRVERGISLDEMLALLGERLDAR